MPDYSQQPKKPIYQHILPVIIRDSGQVLGYVQIPYTKFTCVKEWTFWPKTEPVLVECITSWSDKQMMVIALKQGEQRKVQLLKNYTSMKTMRYTSVWRITKAQTVMEHSLGALTPLINGFVWDSEADYIRNTSPNPDYDGSGDSEDPSNNKSHVDMKWKISVSYNQFVEDYGFADLTWLEFFKKACAKKGIDEIPTSVECIDHPQETRVTFLYDVMQPTDQQTIPALMRVLKLRNIDKGVYPYVIIINTDKTVYRVTINMVIS